ncbi:MAG: hypothetical protein HZC43_04980 [Nitrosomonadales bacterium]|nr:hypothetical protein [Nitrosomonadales bacterium]
MKLNKFALTLIAAALLPTFANAGSDAVVTSFERGLLDGATIVTAAVAEADPLDNFYSILNTKVDAVAASFERDLYRDPIPATTMIAGAADPLADIFNAALHGTADPVLASFERDLYREPVNSAAVISGAADPLADIFHAALGGEIGKTVKQAAITSNHRKNN